MESGDGRWRREVETEEGKQKSRTNIDASLTLDFRDEQESNYHMADLEKRVVVWLLRTRGQFRQHVTQHLPVLVNYVQFTAELGQLVRPNSDRSGDRGSGRCPLGDQSLGWRVVRTLKSPSSPTCQTLVVTLIR